MPEYLADVIVTAMFVLIGVVLGRFMGGKRG